MSLGTDAPGITTARLGYGWALAALFFITGKGRSLARISPAALCFTIFVLFEIARSLIAGWPVRSSHFSADPAWASILALHAHSPFYWSFYLGLFAAGMSMAKRREEAVRLLWLFSLGGFFLALNSLSPLLTKGSAGFIQGNHKVFFHPVFYQNPFLAKYVFGSIHHVNYTGDLVAFGFFASLALFIYGLSSWNERSRKLTAISLILCIVNSLGTVLFLSRGTILSFAGAVGLFGILSLLKFPSRRALKVGGAAFLVIFAGFLVLGAPQKIWKELQTLEREFQSPSDSNTPASSTSLSSNQEGAKRAFSIYRAYPGWGVGTGGYELFSLQFATPGTENNGAVALRALSHYPQLLAEEGKGAFLYFFFLLVYFIEVVWLSFRTKSRLQFYTGLSLLASVALVLAHASFQFLMQQISISSLVYLSMGLGLGVLHADFEKL